MVCFPSPLHQPRPLPPLSGLRRRVQPEGFQYLCPTTATTAATALTTDVRVWPTQACLQDANTVQRRDRWKGREKGVLTGRDGANALWIFLRLRSASRFLSSSSSSSSCRCASSMSGTTCCAPATSHGAPRLTQHQHAGGRASPHKTRPRRAATGAWHDCICQLKGTCTGCAESWARWQRVLLWREKVSENTP